VKKLSCLWTV